MIIFLNIIFLFIFSIVFVSQIKNKKIKKSISVFLTLFIILQLFSFYSTKTLIDSNFIHHFNLRDLSTGYKWFLKELILTPIFFVLIFALIYYCANQISKKIIYNFSRIIIFIIICFPMFLKGGIINNIFKIVIEYQDTDKTLDEALTDIGLPKLKPIEATHNGRNIIILSLESFEAGYLDSSLAHLTPNLNQLKKEWNYKKLEPTSQCGFTFGSLYTLATGIPITGYGNGMGDIPNTWAVGYHQKTQLPNLFNILNKAGYNNQFYIHDANFAGTRDFLNACGEIEIIDHSNIKDKLNFNAGETIHDFDLFRAIESSLTLKSDSIPFSIMMSSISTHFPNGIYDNRYENLVKKEALDMHTMVKAMDYEIGKLITILKEKNLYNKTDIYIFPDHVKMGLNRDVLNNLSPELFLLSNKKLPNKNIYQSDLIDIILSNSNVTHNQKFLCDIDTVNLVNQMYENEFERINILNKAAFKRQNALGNTLKINISDSNEIEILSDNIVIAQFPIIEKGSKIKISFDHTGGIISQGVYPSNDSIENEFELEIYKSFLGYYVILKNDWNKQSDWFWNSTIFNNNNLNTFFNQRTVFTNNEIFKLKNDVNRFIAHAGGVIDDYSYTNSLEALDENYKKGFRLFELDISKTSDGQYVAAHDWEQWKSITQYKDSEVITEKKFLDYKIFGKFTPLNMQRINEWFKKHPDAILVTDKVNEPKAFSNMFIDKKRLMMELFSLDALAEANVNGVKGMASQNVLESLDQNHAAKTLKNLGVEYVAVGRGILRKKKKLFTDLNKAGIKTFIFHINFELGKNEHYVIESELQWGYGIYADNWSFTNPKYTKESNKHQVNAKMQLIDTLKKSSLITYIQSLKDKNVYILIGAMDEASMNYKDQLSPIGSKNILVGKSRWSYIGIFNPYKKYVKEMISDKLIEYKSNYPFDFSIFSAGYTTGNRGDIYINGQIKNQPSRGLNIIVYDIENKLVLDNVQFDVHANSNAERNKLY